MRLAASPVMLQRLQLGKIAIEFPELHAVTMSFAMVQDIKRSTRTRFLAGLVAQAQWPFTSFRLPTPTVSSCS